MVLIMISLSKAAPALASCFVAAWFGSVGAAEEKVDLSGLYTPPAGTTVVESEQFIVQPGELKVVLPNGEKRSRRDSTRESERKITFVNETERKVEFIKEREVVAEETQPGQPLRPVVLDSPLQGRSAVAKRDAKGKWSLALAAKAEATSALDEELKRVGDALTREQDIYAGVKLAVGQTAEIDAGKFGEMTTGRQEAPMRGKARLTLRDLVTIDGEKCALIAMELDLKGERLEPGGVKLTMTLKAAGQVTRSLAKKLDLERTLKGEMSIVGALSGKDGPIPLTISGPISNLKKRKPASP